MKFFKPSSFEEAAKRKFEERQAEIDRKRAEEFQKYQQQFTSPVTGGLMGGLITGGLSGSTITITSTPPYYNTYVLGQQGYVAAPVEQEPTMSKTREDLLAAASAINQIWIDRIRDQNFAPTDEEIADLLLELLEQRPVKPRQESPLSSAYYDGAILGVGSKVYRPWNNDYVIVAKLCHVCGVSQYETEGSIYHMHLKAGVSSPTLESGVPYCCPKGK